MRKDAKIGFAIGGGPAGRSHRLRDRCSKAQDDRRNTRVSLVTPPAAENTTPPPAMQSSSGDGAGATQTQTAPTPPVVPPVQPPTAVQPAPRRRDHTTGESWRWRFGPQPTTTGTHPGVGRIEPPIDPPLVRVRSHPNTFSFTTQ